MKCFEYVWCLSLPTLSNFYDERIHHGSNKLEERVLAILSKH